MNHLNNALLYCEAQRDSLYGVITPSRGAFGWIDWDDARLTLIYLLEKEERRTMFKLNNQALDRGFHHSLVPPLYHSSPEPIPLDEERQSGPDAWEGGFAPNH